MKTTSKQNLLAATLVGGLVFASTVARAADAKNPNIVCYLSSDPKDEQLLWSAIPVRRL